ncbi:hypothetical protein DXG01_014652 [Tephrocybe rancida]|nr:hypothetical protein DXG01_014652 [Tephrocybe rancida]
MPADPSPSSKSHKKRREAGGEPSGSTSKHWGIVPPDKAKTTQVDRYHLKCKDIPDDMEGFKHFSDSETVERLLKGTTLNASFRNTNQQVKKDVADLQKKYLTD